MLFARGRLDRDARRLHRIQRATTGIVIEIEDHVMLVEGGYLHSMKMLIEKATETPDAVVVRPAKRGILSRSLRRLGDFLFGW